MRCKSAFAALLCVPFLAVGAQAGLLAGIWGGHSNDTGGIIPWSPAIAHTYRTIAAEECARWNKVATITSVHRQYGDYVGFTCDFARGYDPRKARWYAPIVTRY
jgi:hypothetical protein